MVVLANDLAMRLAWDAGIYYASIAVQFIKLNLMQVGKMHHNSRKRQETG